MLLALKCVVDILAEVVYNWGRKRRMQCETVMRCSGPGDLKSS